MDAERPYPLLEELLQHEPRLLAEIARQDPYFDRRREYERLLAAARGLPITGLEKLARDSGDPKKFENLAAELKIAVLLARHGASVSILRDRVSGDRYEPDLCAEFANGTRLMVEVSRFSAGDPAFTEGLDVVAAKTHYRLTYHLGPPLSGAAIGHKSRKQATERVRLCLETVERELLRISPTGPRGGALHVFAGSPMGVGVVDIANSPLSPLAEELERCPLRLATVWFEPVREMSGYCGGGVTAANILDAQGHKRNLLAKLKEKCARSARLNADASRCSFAVAIQNDEWSCRPQYVRAALTGSRLFPTRWPSTIGFRPREKYPEAFAAADQQGWEPLLRRLKYGLDARVLFSMEDEEPQQLGAYWSCEWARDLSAVLVLHGSSVVQWLPNPWARSGRNDPSLLNVGLPLEPDGVPTRE
jgi:hypothetical protein